MQFIEALAIADARRDHLALSEAQRIIALHPATLSRYIETVDHLAAVLADHALAKDDRGPLVPDFRALVHSVTIHPKAAREGFLVEVKGKLAALIGGEAFPQAKYINPSISKFLFCIDGVGRE